MGMEREFDNPASAIRCFGEGELGLERVGAAFDALLARGARVEELLDAVETARREGVIDEAQRAELDRAIADSMTVYAGDLTPAGVTDTARDPRPSTDGRAESRTRMAPAAPQASPEAPRVGPGTRLRDRFIIDEVLGVGGMGTVYRGRDALKLEARDRNPYLAIKVLNDSFARRPDAFIALQREASRQQRLAHPNIATVFDFDRSGGTMFITMELLEGRTLDRFIRSEVRPRGGLPPDQAMPIIEQMCAALCHAHQRGIVHADFKPGNCFLTDQGELKVLDFGIARAMKDPAGHPADQTLFDPRSMGALTPAYASPEMLTDSASADPRDDLYALGCVAYELFTGIHPFKRVPADQAMEQGMVPERVKSLSRRQSSTLLRALAFDRDARITSAEEFLEGLGGRRHSVSRRPLGLAAAGLVTVALTGIFAVDYLRDGPERHLEQALASQQSEAVLEALARLDELPPDRGQSVLLAHRVRLLEFFEDRYRALTGVPPREIPFAGVQTLLAAAADLFPDSAAVRDFELDFERLRARHVSDLAARFERYLQPEFLVPSESGDDLHDLLRELAEVAPEHPLLGDVRVASAYAGSAAAALEAGDLDAAQQIVDSGLVLRVGDPALRDIADRIGAAREAARRRARIAGLEDAIRAQADSLEGPDDLAQLARLGDELASLAPQSGALDDAVAAAETWIGERAEAAASAPELATVEAFLEAYRDPLEELGQAQILAPVAARQEALRAERDELVERVRDELAGDGDVDARRRALGEHLEALARIDPGYMSRSPLPEELLQSQLARAERAAMAYEWALAREELVLPRELGLEAEDVIVEKLADLDQRESRFREQLAAERTAEAERRRAQAVAAAEERLEDRLAELALDETGAAALTRAARQLQALDPGNPLVDRATADAAARFLAEARRAAATDDFEGARALLDLATTFTPDAPAIAEARAQVANQEAEWRERDRQDRLTATVAQVESLVERPEALDSAERQSEIRGSLRELESLQAAPAVLAEARRRVADAYLQRGEALIAEKRFTAAARLLDLAGEHQPGTDRLAAARRTLTDARQAYVAERQRLEQQAEIAAAEQQFESELASGRLDRARDILREMSAFAPSGSFFAERAPALLAAAEVRADIEAWVAAPETAEPAEVRRWLADHRSRAPAEHDRLERVWLEAAGARLAPLAGEPESFNRTLARLREVWPEAGVLPDPLEIAEPTPEVRPAVAVLDREVLFGRWCSQEVGLEFSPESLKFLLGRNQEVEYPVKRYVSDGPANITVEWVDPRQGVMLMEFGDFSGDGGSMQQLRGKRADDGTWQEYGRNFDRCG